MQRLEVVAPPDVPQEVVMGLVNLFILHVLLLVVGLALSDEMWSMTSVLALLLIAAGASAALVETTRLLDDRRA